MAGPRPQVVQEDVGIPDDRRQQIVEVVGDTAGETAEGVEFLGLPQLLLE